MAPADTSSTTSRDVAVEELSKAVATVPVRNARSTFDVDACMIYLSLVPNASLRPPDICLSANDDRAMPPIKPDATWNQSMDSSFDILARISLEWICSAGKKVVCLPLFVSLYAKCVTICIVCAAFLGVLHCASWIDMDSELKGTCSGTTVGPCPPCSTRMQGWPCTSMKR